MFRNKKVIIGLLVIIIAACVIVIVYAAKKPSQSNEGTVTAPTQTTAINNNSTDNGDTSNTSTAPSTGDFQQALVKTVPSLKDNQTGQPNFSIVDQQSPQPKWYVLKVRLNTVDTSDATIVLQDQGGKTGLKVILGPGTSFSPQMTGSLPDKVREVLSP